MPSTIQEMLASQPTTLALAIQPMGSAHTICAAGHHCAASDDSPPSA
jgi:hypothetical protein